MTKTPWNVYPRPQMKRQRWLSLNGQWQLEGRPVTVPFPPQSKLSGYGQPVAEQLTYETCFTVPEDWAGSRILLHFSAVDQIAEVWLNGKPVGRHEGGYLPFHFDITKYLHAEENKLTLCATDTLDHTYPYGKQTKKPGGMWYTPVSGIWQSVWLEPVPVDYLHGLRLDCDQKGVTLTLEGWNGGFDAQVEGKHYHFEGNSGRIEPEDPQLWSPEQPHLYPLQITAGEDQIESYFALRSIAIGEVQGVQRVLLNGQPIFLHGVLDQGYFPDGIFLPEDPEEFDRDVLRMKELGLNLLRKHIKIEPEQFYYACDRLGMLVQQDMVNSGGYNFLLNTALPTIGLKRWPDHLGSAHDARKDFFRQHMVDTLHHLHNHPCIIAYTIFNESWGQFRSDAMYRLAKETDPSRLYNSTSGWFAQKESDFDSEHIYFRLKTLSPKQRPLFVSECGGYTMATEGHLYSPDKQYGYGACQSKGELSEKIVELYEKMILPAIPKGCCGCIYTQLSDVEEEINGLYTYDRQVCKVEAEKLRPLAQRFQQALKNK